jgi:tight adherence protein B
MRDALGNYTKIPKLYNSLYISSLTRRHDMAQKASQEAFRPSPIQNLMPVYSQRQLTLAEKLLAAALSFIGGGLVGLVFYGGLFMQDGEATTATFISDGIVFAVIGFLGARLMLPVIASQAREKTREELKSQFRDMLDSLAASFASGINAQGAFEAALRDLLMQRQETDMIVQELREIVNGMKQGVAIDVMLRDFGERSGNEDILNFSDVFEICYRKGGDIKSVVRQTHKVMTEKMSIMEEIKTKLTSNKMQHNVMSVMPIGIAILLKLTNQAFAESFRTPIGVAANTVAIAIFVFAYLYGKKVIDIQA